jgi:hypothetical protein
VGEDGYALLLVPPEEVLAITKSKIKVDAVAVLEELNSAAVARAVRGLQSVQDEGEGGAGGGLEPLSNKDLKLNEVDAIDAYQRCQEALTLMARLQVGIHSVCMLAHRNSCEVHMRWMLCSATAAQSCRSSTV